MKINQETVDAIMFCKMQCAGDYSDLETLNKIRNAIKDKFGVELSNAEAHVFWSWRSEQHEASFLTYGGNNEAIEWFGKFFNDWYDGDNDEDFVSPYEIKENK